MLNTLTETWWIPLLIGFALSVSHSLGRLVGRREAQRETAKREFLPYIWKCPNPTCPVSFSSNDERLLNRVVAKHEANHA